MSAKIQFNLLPDTKIEKDRSKKTHQLVTTVAIAASTVSLAIFILLFLAIGIVQKQQMNNAGKSVDSANSQLNQIPNLDQIITVQNQLQTLVSLHQNKHVTSRLFTYLGQLTPSNVSFSKLNLDLTSNTITITGNADAQATVNSFIDTLKSTTYKVGSTDSTKAFSSVVESGFSINPTNVSFDLTLQFDPKLFANNILDSSGKPQTPQLSVPKQTTANGDSIFQAQ